MKKIKIREVGRGAGGGGEIGRWGNRKLFCLIKTRSYREKERERHKLR
jgi:hypothetical protein